VAGDEYGILKKIRQKRVIHQCFLDKQNMVSG
jgi:hypothetical protein